MVPPKHPRIDQHVRGKALQASYNLCLLSDGLRDRDSRQRPQSTETFLQRLQAWCKALPQELRLNSERLKAPLQIDDRNCLMASTHVACFYFFVIIICTRNYLLLPSKSNIGRPRRSMTRPSKLDKSSTDMQLANVCSGAAVNLAETAHVAVCVDNTPGNLCIMK